MIGGANAVEDSLACNAAKEAAEVRVHSTMRIDAQSSEVSTLKSSNRAGVIRFGIADDFGALGTLSHFAPVLLLMHVGGGTRVADGDISERGAFLKGLVAVRAEADTIGVAKSRLIRGRNTSAVAHGSGAGNDEIVAHVDFPLSALDTRLIVFRVRGREIKAVTTCTSTEAPGRGEAIETLVGLHRLKGVGFLRLEVSLETQAATGTSISADACREAVLISAGKGVEKGAEASTLDLEGEQLLQLEHFEIEDTSIEAQQVVERGRQESLVVKL